MRFFTVFFGFGIFALALLVGCSLDGDKDEDLQWETGSELCDQCLNSAPEPDDFEFKIPEEDDKAFYKALGELAEYYHMTVDISRGLNGWVLGTLSILDEILSYPPTQHGDDVCIWGPFIPNGLSPVEVRFQMTKHSDEDFEYLWDERLKNTDDEFTAIWGGNITPATDTARRGIGNLFIDFTAAQTLDPTWDASGLMNVDYDTYTDGRELDVTFEQFQPEDAAYPTDATYYYHNRADNSGRFAFEHYADIWFEVGDTPGETDFETMNQETLWHENGEGYSTMTITGGDIEDLIIVSFDVAYLEGFECWNEVFERTYFCLKAFDATGDEMVLPDVEGDEADCTQF